MAARVDVEQVVGRQREAQRAFGAPGAEIHLGVDHRVAIRRCLERGDALLVADPLDLAAHVELRRLDGQPAEQAQRRDARGGAGVLDGRVNVVGEAVGDEAGVPPPCQRQRSLHLEAVIARVGLAEGIDGQPVFEAAGQVLVDEVLEPGVVGGGLQAVVAARSAQDRLDADRALGAEVGIADLEGVGAGVRPVGEQFLGRRRALCARDVDAEAPVAGEAIRCAGRGGEHVELAAAVEELRLAGRRLRLERGALVAGASLELQRVVVELLQGEDAELLGAVLGEEGLVADDVEIADEELRAGHAAPGAVLRLGQLQPAFQALIIERGAHAAVLFQLEVAIVRIAEAEADLVEQAAAGVDLGAGVDAVLQQAEARRLLLLPGLCGIADRHAVEAVVVAVGQADVAVLADVGGADARGPGLAGGVGQVAAHRGVGGEVDWFVGIGRKLARCQRLRAQRRGQRVAADAQVVGLRIAAVGVDHPAAADRRIDRGRDRALVRRRAVRRQRRDVDRLVGHRHRDAAVDHVDHAADRRGTVEQRLRPAQHLDALGKQRADHGGVIGRGVRHVDRAEPVGHHLDALALQAAQHRARGAGAERGGRGAGRVGQRLADRGTQRLDQRLALNQRDAREHVLAGGRQRAGDDDLRVAVVIGVGPGVLARALAGAVAIGGFVGLRGDGQRHRDHQAACAPRPFPHVHLDGIIYYNNERLGGRLGGSDSAGSCVIQYYILFM